METGATEDEMFRQHHRPNGHKFGQTLGDSGGQRSLVGCCLWGRAESDTTEVTQQQQLQRTPGLISFRMDWLDLLAVQGTLKNFPQHHSSKASILWRSVFFTVQLSHPYMTTGKTIALTRQTLVGSHVSAFKYAIQVGHNFSSKEQASFNFMVAITICSDFGAPPNKICHCFHCFSIYLP